MIARKDRHMTTPSANPNRDPSKYVLVAKIGGTQQHPDLLRLDPDVPVPPGWKSVQHLHGNPVYQPDGSLRQQFWALRRYPQDFPKANSAEESVMRRHPDPIDMP
jgi:hypothetical protein